MSFDFLTFQWFLAVLLGGITGNIIYLVFLEKPFSKWFNKKLDKWFGGEE